MSKMYHKVPTALTFHTLLLVIAIYRSAGSEESVNFLQKCGQSVQAETYEVPETFREPVEQNGQEDINKYLYRFPLLENSIDNCSTGLKKLNLNTSVRGSVFWTSTGYLATPPWSYPPERHCISKLVTHTSPAITAFIYYIGGINLVLYGISLSFTGWNVYTLCRLKRETRILNSNWLQLDSHFCASQYFG